MIVKYAKRLEDLEVTRWGYIETKEVDCEYMSNPSVHKLTEEETNNKMNEYVGLAIERCNDIENNTIAFVQGVSTTFKVIKTGSINVITNLQAFIMNDNGKTIEKLY